MAQEERMEVDQCACAAAGAAMPAGSGGGAVLRRSNSAPMISNISDSSPVFQPTLLRCRRSSASVNLSCPSSSFPLSPFRTFSSRIDQIRQEESMDVMNRETAHERGIHTAMQMSCTREDGFTLCDQMVTAEQDDRILTLRREDIFPLSPSPSPTRIGKQYFSSSQPILIPKGGVTPNSSPSPTRRIASRRSVSPSVALRPSALGPLKRKGDMEVDSPPKKLFVSGVPGIGNAETTLLTPLLSHSLECVINSPPQTVPPSGPYVATSPSATEIGFTSPFTSVAHPPGM
ncbi:P2R1A-PPP2R2A-interacting phosphatase regulator 1-like isoform X1 [Carcharodon carcharias]|uniref:P2R1A-PPP2R2A-interacting phosphatase regulator 1-like isoform X1 n=1 Tax=Carcharodon carcharias TaxID=13397 RepID=UPI001B7EC9A4|nr:P2R1A-PPP2R2A-interacting phosphatase regulator 1-like isoform X1 [Carcharodon carcharias]